MNKAGCKTGPSTIRSGKGLLQCRRGGGRTEAPSSLLLGAAQNRGLVDHLSFTHGALGKSRSGRCALWAGKSDPVSLVPE